MTKPITYAKNEFAAGRHPMINIEPGENGTFWFHDADWKMLDHTAFTSRDKAEKARSKILDKARKSTIG